MEYTQKESDLIVLDSFEKLSYKAKWGITEGFEQSPDFVKFKDALIKSLGLGVYNKLREDFCSVTYRSQVLAKLEQDDVYCITWLSEDYPDEWRGLDEPPMVLYARGDRTLLSRTKLAVVGSRKVTPYAAENCRKIVQNLSQEISVCTGLSDGCERVATETAVANGVVCLLAHGHNVCYPASSADLKAKVEQNGLVISEYPPTVQALKFHFPRRNMLLAALTDGTLVVAAGQKSGALITAEYALGFGKDVFAFPYNIDVTSGVGCNALIKKGAHLVENTLDIAEVFGLHLKKQTGQSLNADEKKVLDVLRPVGELHINEIANLLGVQPHELFVALSSLEVKKRIVRMAGNRYAVV